MFRACKIAQAPGQPVGGVAAQRVALAEEAQALREPWPVAVSAARLVLDTGLCAGCPAAAPEAVYAPGTASAWSNGVASDQ